jgi:hypothetical protein
MIDDDDELRAIVRPTRFMERLAAQLDSFDATDVDDVMLTE